MGQSTRRHSSVRHWDALALCMLLCVASAEEQQVHSGQLQTTAVHGKSILKHPAGQKPANGSTEAEHDHFEMYHLRLRTGEMRQLKFPKQPAYIPRSGTWVQVTPKPPPQCGLPADSSILCVGRMSASEDAPRDSYASGQPRGKVQFRALIMQLQVCGQGPATTPDNLAGALFDGLPNSQAENLQGMFRTCSYSNADFSQLAGGTIVKATVPIPCSGQTPWGVSYDSSTCPFTEWSDVANNYVKEVLGYDWNSFKFKIYVVPPGDLCSWGGMGWVGCKVDCRAWISGDLWEYPATWMHELGHNLYLNHAGSYQTQNGVSQFLEYTDDSGTMGHCCATRCYNAPHAFQLGWSKPIGVLYKDNFPTGEWHSYVLPPRVGVTSSDANMLRVYGDWNPQSAGYNLYLEYRKGQSYDNGLSDNVRNRVTFYSTRHGDSMPFTTFEAAIAENQILRETRIGSNLAIWVGGVSPKGIRIHLCRPESAREEQCGDGKDNDCNGFTDSDDPHCHPSTRKLKQAMQKVDNKQQIRLSSKDQQPNKQSHAQGQSVPGSM